jgi:hypothetical protein
MKSAQHIRVSCRPAGHLQQQTQANSSRMRQRLTISWKPIETSASSWQWRGLVWQQWPIQLLMLCCSCSESCKPGQIPSSQLLVVLGEVPAGVHSGWCVLTCFVPAAVLTKPSRWLAHAASACSGAQPGAQHWRCGLDMYLL